MHLLYSDFVNICMYKLQQLKMGLSGSSMIPADKSVDSPPPECPVHNKKPGFSQSAAAGECPASFDASQFVASEADVDPKNMVSGRHLIQFACVQFCCKGLTIVPAMKFVWLSCCTKTS